MPKVDVYNMQGKKVSDVELSEAVFGIEPNENIVHSALVNYLANQRQGTQSTKTRAEVSGGGRKPWRQKGTGRARQGSIRAPQWIKGGIALGPKPRSYSYRINKKEKQLAIRSLLSAKVLDNELTVVDKLEVEEAKTKVMAKALTDLKVEGKALIILADRNDNVLRSSRNIEGVKTIELNNLSIRQLRERIKSNEYERLPESTKNKLINQDETNVVDYVKNPIMIKNNNNYEMFSERVLQKIILEDIENFLEELGIGFTFIKSEYPIKLGNRYNYIDLLLYNIKYKCYVVVELKVTELKKEHTGQIMTYMNYIDKNIKTIYENETVGIIICKKNNKYVIEFCSDKRIITREYELV